MIKVFGGILIIIACGSAGFIKGQHYAKRPVQLRMLRSALQSLETEITWSATPLPEALKKVGSISAKPVNFLFMRAGDLIDNNAGVAVGDLWKKAVIDSRNYLDIEKEDREILISFGFGLGNSHREEQVKNLSLVREHLKSMEFAAEGKKQKYEKMYRTLGILLGMVIALILL